ncbi:MAG: hypothetical protein HFI96_16080 [Lachnospiraceae bacterium]|nr:hypothetical protein [Lachnospiraceae bacterium]MCI9097440.1 hypothetical protein [Lachnospiraceae bacterium]
MVTKIAFLKNTLRLHGMEPKKALSVKYWENDIDDRFWKQRDYISGK